MTYYFHLGTALKEGGASGFDRMVRVYESPAETGFAPADLLKARGPFDLLDFTSPEEATMQFEALLEKINLYKVSAELVLDEAFRSADKGNDTLRVCLVSALGDHVWPEPAHDEEPSSIEETIVSEGELRYPFIGHLSKTDMAALFSRFMANADPACLEEGRFGLGAVIRPNKGLFFKEYDGYATPSAIFIRLETLIFNAMRADTDPNIPLEEYVQNGTQRASTRGELTPGEHLGYYLASDRFQKERCLEIHSVLHHGGGFPPWVRTDVFHVLEHEAMKQHHAGKFLAAPDVDKMLAAAPHLRAALQANARGEVSEMLQRLLQETLSAGSGYAGAALQFAEDAGKRAAEATSLSFSKDMAVDKTA